MNKKRVLKYFDRQAQKYDLLFSSFYCKRFRKLEKESILELLCPQYNDNILDAGSGTGFYAQILRYNGCNILAVDFSAKMIEELKKKQIMAKKCDLEELELSERFKKIICAGVMEFSDNHVKLLNNLKEHLENNGFMVLLIPRFSLMGIIYKLFHLSHGINIQLFTLSRIRYLLKKCNLRLIDLKTPTSFSYVIKVK